MNDKTPKRVFLLSKKENGRIITTAEQAGTTAIRPAFEALEYTFKYVYNVIGKEWPMAKIEAFIAACRARKNLRSAKVGTMGYRDMLLYGTQTFPWGKVTIDEMREK